MSKLITGGTSNPFLPELCHAVAHADDIAFAVAFVKVTGLRLLRDDLLAILAPPTSEAPAHELHEVGARVADAKGNYRLAPTTTRVRILTSDYLDVTDPEALRLLMLFAQRGAEVRVFESAGSSFHLKAYLFARRHGGLVRSGEAFIGSSNISAQALTDGLEWNYRVEYPGDDGYLEAWQRFEALFDDPRAVPLTDDWIASYEARRKPPSRPIAPGSHEVEAPPTPTPVQDEALEALARSREAGYSRGLVVLATGMGKTWLSAFDARQFGARRVLFVAHREEILDQAAETFARIWPRSRVGFYMGQQRDVEADVLCGSVQTLGREAHLDRFSPAHFDYIVVDEFHHAAAPTYRRLLAHFDAAFLLGLTATPDRTDRSDILSLCDDNLVFTRDLFSGIEAGLLSPFHYFGILDESVDYQEIPWRNGRFDPESLSVKLATLARARHALRQWRAHALDRTLAFCVSIKHADFMAESFQREGVAAAAVHGRSDLSRREALDQLASGNLRVVFSVDLFSEGVDLPEIDTILMLRPTESKILFLQQLGRGLRKAEGKERLVVLDFIGNHHAFLHKAQALGRAGATYRELAEFARKLERDELTLPDGCFINYDLALLDFLKALDASGPEKDYVALRESLGRRPTLMEFHRSGSSITQMRRQFGSWLGLLSEQEDLTSAEAAAFHHCNPFLSELETTAMSKSFKMVLLEAFQELDGWRRPPTLEELANRSRRVLDRRRSLLADLPERFQTEQDPNAPDWRRYWRGNPIGAWAGENRKTGIQPFFAVSDGRFVPRFDVDAAWRDALIDLTQELIDYRLGRYEERAETSDLPESANRTPSSSPGRQQLAYFPNLQIACGRFRVGRTDADEIRGVSSRHGPVTPERHFIARASGRSMDGGEHPIRDGDLLLMELIRDAAPESGTVVAVRRDTSSNRPEYLLREIVANIDSEPVLLRAYNSGYADMTATDDMAFEARLVDLVDPLEFEVGREFLREEIPPLFGVEFNPGNWNSGQVVLSEQRVHVLLVTLNKQGKAEDHRYLDHWIDEDTFHWQSQRSTTPQSKRGREIIEHREHGIQIHLFVRQRKLRGKTAAPFTYCGEASYHSHTGSAPMNVVFDVPDAAEVPK